LVMTDPCDPETGVPSAWGTMVEEMSLKGKHNYKGEFVTEWKYQ